MEGFVVECLFDTGWRRAGVLFWLLPDAEAEAKQSVSEHARAARILAVTIHPETIMSIGVKALAGVTDG